MESNVLEEEVRAPPVLLFLKLQNEKRKNNDIVFVYGNFKYFDLRHPLH